MMKNIRLIVLILTIATLSACDPIYDAVIKNESDSNVILQITFNAESIHPGGRTYYLSEFPFFERIAPPLKMDTINLICSYVIPPGDNFPICSEIARYPDYTLFKELLILKPDSLIYRGQDEISSAFKRTGEFHWVLSNS